MKQLDLYKIDWMRFKDYCDQKAKAADCYINNKGWQKLKEYHLSHYLNNMENPFAFLYNIRLKHRNIYCQVKCMPRYYHKYLKERQKLLDSPSQHVVQFPTWRKRS